ncbi:MAG: DUF952 domain-containing protein [Alteromonadaceae bacterium]|nr:DUF952 domain-containing protein [Alteromonadaceae bacterium]
MGFKVEVNSILRSDAYDTLQQGETYTFEKSGSRIFFDDIPVWLTRNDWTALAEISIVSQTRQGNKLTGQFRVDYKYQDDEQKAVTDVFIRMYAGMSDPYIYLLSSQQEYDKAMDEGKLVRDSRKKGGFIHASPAAQLNRVANKHYLDKVDPLVLIVDKKQVTPEIKWEPATGGLYPHIFDPLNMNAVVKSQKIAKGKYGLFNIKIDQ